MSPLPANSSPRRRHFTPESPVFNLLQPNSQHPANSLPAASSKGAAAQVIRVSWSQSNRRACGGARPSGNIANSAEGSLPFRCARILSITAGSSMQAMILTCPLQRSQVSISIRMRPSQIRVSAAASRSSPHGAPPASCPASSPRKVDAACVPCPF